MAKRSKYLIIAGLAMLVAGCGRFAIHKTDILQGNYVDETRLENIALGMTKEQVQLYLGTPLVRDPFDNNTWYYVYKHSLSNGELLEHRNLRVYFDNNGQLAHLDYVDQTPVVEEESSKRSFFTSD